ncbi:GATA transcription factor 17-like [Brachypodium distachyon]|uniref:GATA transcription factor 17-like n=1 Tax=Brachypodium distachyon TaxID=15368 RepID=UPI000D0CA5C8|nr:GATA transcription factor 17-like [Brachypodium distachyon]|eukprot:XP_024316459.1 GATA transcription factor 17-like [Brachypodium distachyon]
MSGQGSSKPYQPRRGPEPEQHLLEPQQQLPQAAPNAEAAGGGDPAAAAHAQLTLSYQGELFVFDSVSPDKVQAVLLLLGGELAPGLGLETSSSNKAANSAHRMASIIRYRKKRSKRNYDKKIRYSVRKEIAHRMQRHKGQFTSAKAKAEEATTSGITSDGSRYSLCPLFIGAFDFSLVPRRTGAIAF